MVRNMSEKSTAIEIAESSSCYELQYQRQLFPIKINDFYPNDQGSADLTLIGSGDNGKDYAIKRIGDGNGMIPASELFCYELARQVGIATPAFDIVLLRADELAFGSVWEGGVYKLSALNMMADLLKKGSLDDAEVKSLDKFFGKVYAFDLFINNVDRHFGNYIFRKSYNSYIALAFDYSRAWCAVDYKGLQVVGKNCNTQQSINIIKQFKKFNRQQANDTLNELSRIGRSTIENILSEMPKEWMTKEQTSEIMEWWGSTEFKDRLLALEKEVANVLV